MTRRWLYCLAFTAIWMVLLAAVVKISLDRLPAPTWASPAGSESPLEVKGDTQAPGSQLDGAQAYVNGQPASDNLQFKTFDSLRTRDRLRLMLSRMAAGRPYMFGSEGFYVGLGLVYAVVLGAFMRKVAGAIFGEQGGGP